RETPALPATSFSVTRSLRVSLCAMTSPLTCLGASEPRVSPRTVPAELVLTGIAAVYNLNHNVIFSSVLRHFRPPGAQRPLTGPHRGGSCMALFDLSLDALREYRPPLAEPADLDTFWDETLTRSREAADPILTLERADNALTLIDTWDVSFAGHDGTPVRAWYNRPAGATADLPVVVEYIGYGGGRGEPLERLAWAAAGYGHLLLDTRGQGSGWGPGGAGRHDPRHRVAAHLVPHPPAHRCGPCRGRRPRTARGRRTHRGHRQQPGRRARARRRGPGARRRRPAHQRPVPHPHAPRGRHHRRRPLSGDRALPGGAPGS